MPSPERTSIRRRDVDVEYSYRRNLDVLELLPAIGLGVGAGLFAFYVARIMLQRTPLKVERGGQDMPKGALVRGGQPRIRSRERSARR